MARKSKNTIAKKMYDWEFDELSGGQKAAVTKAFNAQTVTPTPRARARAPARVSRAGVRVEIGRIGNGPLDAFVMTNGSTVEDLLAKAKLKLNTKKGEGVVAQTTGQPVSLDSEVVTEETYVLTPEIESAK